MNVILENKTDVRFERKNDDKSENIPLLGCIGTIFVFHLDHIFYLNKYTNFRILTKFKTFLIIPIYSLHFELEI